MPLHPVTVYIRAENASENEKERRNARRRPFLRGENLFLLEQEAGGEHGDGAKKPFNTP
jgi:hypothetical protein